MTYATDAERLALKNSSSSFDGCAMVVRFEKNGRQSELVADDVDHALSISGQWVKNGANYVEIFRVNDDGSLKATIGAWRSGE